jgi:O-antigen/teichoic acid export membrane protein
MARIPLPRTRRSLGARNRLGGSLLASGAGQALLVVSGVLVARALGPADRGYFALLVVVSSVCTLLGSGGLPTALTYFIARDRGSARAILGSLVAPVAVQVAATAVVQFGVMFVFVHGDPQRVKVAALVSLLLVPGILAQNYGLAILQGQERFFPFNVFRVLPSLVYTAAVLAAFILGVADIVVLMAMWALALLTPLQVWPQESCRVGLANRRAPSRPSPGRALAGAYHAGLLRRRPGVYESSSCGCPKRRDGRVSGGRLSVEPG